MDPVGAAVELPPQRRTNNALGWVNQGPFGANRANGDEANHGTRES